MAAKPPAKKSGKKSGNATSFKPGPDPRRGKGPAPGAPNAGRPADAERERLDAILSSPKGIKALETVLTSPDHPAYPKLYAVASERAYGSVKQSLDVTASVAYEQLVDASHHTPSAEDA